MFTFFDSYFTALQAADSQFSVHSQSPIFDQTAPSNAQFSPDPIECYPDKFPKRADLDSQACKNTCGGPHFIRTEKRHKFLIFFVTCLGIALNRMKMVNLTRKTQRRRRTAMMPHHKKHLIFCTIYYGVKFTLQICK